MITKTFREYNIPLAITDNIRNLFKSKLWRLGKCLSATGGKKRAQTLDGWKNSSWEFKVNKSEFTNLLESRKRKFEAQLYEETSKRQKLEQTVQQLSDKISSQTEEIAVLKEVNKNNSKALAETKKRYLTVKPWKECTRQQKYNRKKFLAQDVEEALDFCENKGFKPQSVEFQNIDTGEVDVLDVSTGSFSGKENFETTTTLDDKAHSLLYVKDKFSISDKAFHELTSIVPALPKSGQVKK